MAARVPRTCPALATVAALALASLACAAPAIPLDGLAAAHTYTGHGGLSAGASSRLLWDYPVAQQKDILDMLFLPQHGLGLHMLKVEIGGDAQSTDGTEPSHSHFRGDLSCTRGYELFLLREAKKRNPAVLTYGLSWGAPGYINNGTSFFGAEMQEYQVSWARCIEQELGFKIDYIGVWNERQWGGPDYIRGLRTALDAAGFGDTRIIIPDGGYDASIMASAKTDAAFNSSFDGIGLHYPCDQPHPEVAEGGKLYWASEDWWDQPDWSGAATWGHLLVSNYVLANMTSTIAWSPLWSVYPGLEDQAAGLILASEPWSGHWDVSPPVWTGAHFSQFTEPGWRFLSVPSGSSGKLPQGGMFVSLVPPDGGGAGLTMILETFGKESARCPGESAAGTQMLTFALQHAPLPGPGATLFVWQTNATDFFIEQPSLVVATDGTFSVSIAPATMVTVTTVAGGRKGVPAGAIPASAPFPLPYADDFGSASYPFDAMARFFSDQFGSFAVRNGALRQVAPIKPGNLAWSGDTDPFSLIGDATWRDTAVSATVTIEPAASATSIRADTGAAALLAPCDAGSALQRWAWGVPEAGYLSNTPGGAGVQQCLNSYGCGETAVYWDCISSGGTCCGAACYDGLRWTLSEDGQIVSALADVGCLTAAGTNLSLGPCRARGDAAQTFVVEHGTGHVRLASNGSSPGLCLSQPPPPPPPTPYAQLCTRIASYAAFSLPKPPPGYCIALAASGNWTLTSKIGVLASGRLAAPPVPGQGVELRIAAAADVVTASADGVQLASVSDSAHLAGMAGIGCGWSPSAAFAGFRIDAAARQ